MVPLRPTLTIDKPRALAAAIIFAAAATGLIIVTLLIAYLPTLYAAFNRRETEVALLNARAGIPSWGPELLARTHYALGSGMSTLNTMPDLYAQWERWGADVAESHTTYLTLVRFRSPGALSSWVTSLLAVLDSAALYLALSPQSAPVVPARLCLRSGFTCFYRIAVAMGLDVPDERHLPQEISLTYQEFLVAVDRMREVSFPIERDPRRRVAGLRRLAGQLRAGRVQGGLRRRCRPRAVVRSPPASQSRHPPRTPAPRTAPQVGPSRARRRTSRASAHRPMPAGLFRRESAVCR